MDIKNKIKKSFVFPYLVYVHYWVVRYLVKRRLKPDKLFFKTKIQPVSNGINFFGYYNISPTNSNGDILYLKVKKENVRGSFYEPALVMLKQANGIEHQIAATKAWNWQQGCMLQWMPGSTTQILFNDYDEETNSFVTKLIDINGHIIKQFNKAIYNVSKTGNYALSLNYDRLAQMRADYGYFNRGNAKLPLNKEDGIWHINLKSGESSLIISLEQLIKLKYVSSMEDAKHKVNHIDTNPDGTRFMFLHRWIGPKGRFMRLITSNPDGSNLQILNGDSMTSHCCWISNTKILSFCSIEESKTGYYLFTDLTREKELFSKELPVFDGHPSISPNRKYIITDSYPDKSRMSYLYLYDIKNNKLITLGRFYQPLRFTGENRIDLHPKWNYKGDEIYFESGHSGIRKLYCLYFESNAII